MRIIKQTTIDAWIKLDEQFPGLCTVEEYDAFSVETIRVVNKLITIINSQQRDNLRNTDSLLYATKLIHSYPWHNLHITTPEDIEAAAEEFQTELDDLWARWED